MAFTSAPIPAIFAGMAYESDTLNRRTLGPAIASGVVGIALGVVAVVGVSVFSSANSLPDSGAKDVDAAVLGDPEYGSRN